MFRHIEILSALFCLLLLYQNVNTKSCPAGQHYVYGTETCVDCPKDQYSHTAGVKVSCVKCTKCEEGSEVDLECKPTSDTRCRCKPGFTPEDAYKYTLCKCEVGYGLELAGQIHVCTKCRDGFFSNKQNSICQKWKECKSGIRIPGNNTSDAVCINASEEVTDVHTVISTSTPMTTTTSYIAPSITTASSSKNKDRLYILWLVLVCGGFLLVMGLLYHKCIITRCILKNTKVVSRKESACKKPVEESGEKCLSLLV